MKALTFNDVALNNVWLSHWPETPWGQRLCILYLSLSLPNTCPRTLQRVSSQYPLQEGSESSATFLFHGFHTDSLLFSKTPPKYFYKVVVHSHILHLEITEGADRSSFNFQKREPANDLELHSLMLLESSGPQEPWYKAVFKRLNWLGNFINSEPSFYPGWDQQVSQSIALSPGRIVFIISSNVVLILRKQFFSLPCNQCHGMFFLLPNINSFCCNLITPFPLFFPWGEHFDNYSLHRWITFI